MSDPDRIDYRGFTVAVAAATKPNFADVVARSARYRRLRNWFAGGAVALAVAIGGGTAAAVTAGTPSPKPSPSPSPQPWHTTLPQADGLPKGQPSYIEITPGLWDPAQRDQELTGMYPELKAGDLDHLYLEYQDCAANPCKHMIAVTADRGRTWNKRPLPVDPELGQTGLSMVYHSMVVAAKAPKLDTGQHSGPINWPDPVYWTSLDAGVTWHKSTIQVVDALPVGWPIHDENDSIAAVDPATGNVARLKDVVDDPKKLSNSRMVIDTPPAAGIWELYQAAAGPAVKISHDGGRTWTKRPLPSLPSSDGSSGFGRGTLATVDGRTAYLTKVDNNVLHLHISVDGGNTWRTRPDITLTGPLLSLLPIDDNTVLIETLQGTFRSTDQARTFTRVGPSLGARAHAIPGGFTIPTNNNEYSAWVSPDGAEWTYVKRPEVP